MQVSRDIAPAVLAAASSLPVITLTGPRQSGKSTLCRDLFPERPFVNLEAPDVRAFASEDPRRFLAGLPDGAVLDEIQQVPSLPSYLQGMVDADPTPGRWILTGSQNLQLLTSVSQSLAGRTAIFNLLPMHLDELRRFPAAQVADRLATLDTLLLAGGYPRIYDRGGDAGGGGEGDAGGAAARPPVDATLWLSSYVATYVERDVRTLAEVGDLVAFQRFLELCAGRTAQLLNLSTLAADAGVSQPTAKAWLSILEATFIVFRLPPLHRNIGKRLGRMPKLHFHDVGLASWLLGIRSVEELRRHPLRGALFETWVVTEFLKRRAAAGERATGWPGIAFYREQGALEVDLVVERAGAFLLVDAKAGATPARDMLDSARRVAERLTEVGSSRCAAVYGGAEFHQLADGSRIVPWGEIGTLLIGG